MRSAPRVSESEYTQATGSCLSIVRSVKCDHCGEEYFAGAKAEGDLRLNHCSHREWPLDFEY